MTIIQVDNTLILLTDNSANDINEEIIYDGSLGEIKEFKYTNNYVMTKLIAILTTESGIYILLINNDNNEWIKVKDDVADQMLSSIDVCIEFYPLLVKVLTCDFQLINMTICGNIIVYIEDPTSEEFRDYLLEIVGDN